MNSLPPPVPPLCDGCGPWVVRDNRVDLCSAKHHPCQVYNHVMYIFSAPWTSIRLSSLSPSIVVLAGPRGKLIYCCCEEVLPVIERNMKDVTVAVMSLPDRSPDRPADCARLYFPVNEMSSFFPSVRC